MTPSRSSQPARSSQSRPTSSFAKLASPLCLSRAPRLHPVCLQIRPARPVMRILRQRRRASKQFALPFRRTHHVHGRESATHTRQPLVSFHRMHSRQLTLIAPQQQSQRAPARPRVRSRSIMIATQRSMSLSTRTWRCRPSLMAVARRESSRSRRASSCLLTRKAARSGVRRRRHWSSIQVPVALGHLRQRSTKRASHQSSTLLRQAPLSSLKLQLPPRLPPPLRLPVPRRRRRTRTLQSLDSLRTRAAPLSLLIPYATPYAARRLCAFRVTRTRRHHSSQGWTSLKPASLSHSALHLVAAKTRMCSSTRVVRTASVAAASCSSMSKRRRRTSLSTKRASKAAQCLMSTASCPSALWTSSSKSASSNRIRPLGQRLARQP